jgi:8-oxo-dGTP diphosphatase
MPLSTELAGHSVSVAGVVVDSEGRALLIQRRDNHRWEPPGGVLELHESIEDGLRREVREETGLDVEPVTLSGVYKNMRRGIIALVFRCTVTGGELGVSDETESYRWVSEADIAVMASEAFAVRVLDALRDGEPAAIRMHDGTNLL